MVVRIILLATLGSALASASLASDFKRIESKAEYLSIAADKKIAAPWGWFIASSNGELKGRVKGKSATGSWDWEGAYWCRTMTFGKNKLERNCQEILVSGNKLVHVRDKGKGPRTRMKIK